MAIINKCILNGVMMPGDSRGVESRSFFVHLLVKKNGFELVFHGATNKLLHQHFNKAIERKGASLGTSPNSVQQCILENSYSFI